MTDLCIHCSCPATVQVVTGEQLCSHCYEHAPLVIACPNCRQGFAADSPVPSGVESVGDAGDAGFPTASPAPIARAGVPPATPARVPLEQLQRALRGCIQFCEDEWSPLDPVDADQIDRALAGLSLLGDAITALYGYRSMGHVVADEPGWYVVTSWVPKDVVDMATDVLQRVKP